MTVSMIRVVDDKICQVEEREQNLKNHIHGRDIPVAFYLDSTAMNSTEARTASMCLAKAPDLTKNHEATPTSRQASNICCTTGNCASSIELSAILCHVVLQSVTVWNSLLQYMMTCCYAMLLLRW